MPGIADDIDGTTQHAAHPLRQSINIEYTDTRVSRNISIDVYRGFVMLLMMAEVLRLSSLARAYPGNPILDFLAFSPVARGLGRLFPARHDSAILLFSCRCFAPLCTRQPTRQGG